MVFWVLTGAVTLAVVIILSRQMLRKSPEADRAEVTSDMQIYRDQLKELERDIERGTVTGAEADRTRLEISRRLLDADRAAKARTVASDAPDKITRGTAGIAALVLILGGFGLYWILGSPGVQDLGQKKRIAMAQEVHDTRPGQAEIEAQRPAWEGPPAETPADYLELIKSLRASVGKKPDDPKGLDLLVQHETNLGNHIAAREAMDHLIAVKGEDATANDFARQADVMIMTAGGYVSPEAEEALRLALIKEPRNHVARYYTGLLFAQTDRPDLAFRMWRALLEEGPDGAPWITPIRSQIGFLAQAAGVDYTPPAPRTTPAGDISQPGPTAEDIEAAQDMSEADRGEMIQSMVERLSERLATEGGTPDEWARLISVLGVLGNTERAAAIWGEAQDVFTDHPDALDVVRIAAKQAGVAE
ncbi:c-type cytochrome biogenesis protein CcmI [Aliiroseovarius lamellibrachiae]|uniref:c-type cytochrome biogenesis protein CcmI n=1 Tax=Aliiroseovarius lamellibrachiae TaxID=1924933 RepID=UPI001BE01BED|nr:c-type cytochrome biogenesis protein CcmI [Aliiroseovarius lamellibrachiae]MBT2131186.1 c-type cytochrome biogenesis protein CcmI [Aliiroseovarius lamellibrachiae]